MAAFVARALDLRSGGTSPFVDIRTSIYRADIEAIYRFPSGNAHVAFLDGYLYVTGRIDHRIYRYDIETEEVVVVVGTGEEGFEDGPGEVATIARPNAIAVGPEGVLYINHGGGDGRNDPVWIRKITPSS